jgi:uncharacterized tellurite resistance protein B-like protein
MDTISFDKLLLKTAFCCMAADGKIDNREIALIKGLCEKSPIFVNFDFQEEINLLVAKINNGGKSFVQYYFDLLKRTELSEEEELTLIDFAIQTIKADEQVEYSEIKFFKNIRHRLNVSDKKILDRYPDIERFLEDDIMTDDFLDKIANQFFELYEWPKFENIVVGDDNFNLNKNQG